MNIGDEKISYVIIGNFNILSRIKNISVGETVHSIHYSKISSIIENKRGGIEICIPHAGDIELNSVKIFNREFLQELIDKYYNYNSNNDLIEENTINPITKADTLIKYKELLDEGALTQEEFDKLKNELING